MYIKFDNLLLDRERKGNKVSNFNSYKTLKQIALDDNKLQDYVVKCKCGHSILMREERLLCYQCGHYVYRDEKTKLKYKLREMLRK